MLSSPLAHLIAALVLVAALQGFVVKLYAIPSGSMEPTLTAQDRILVNRLAYSRSAPEAGDVVVFHRPESWREGEVEQPHPLRVAAGWVGDVVGFGPSNHQAMVKRIAATPGQRISVRGEDGRVLVDGSPVPGDSTVVPGADPSGGDTCGTSATAPCPADFVMPEGEYLVLGDNRAVSSDSFSGCLGGMPLALAQCLRTVPREDVVGAVVAIAYPVGRWGDSARL